MVLHIRYKFCKLLPFNFTINFEIRLFRFCSTRIFKVCLASPSNFGHLYYQKKKKCQFGKLRQFKKAFASFCIQICTRFSVQVQAMIFSMGKEMLDDKKCITKASSRVCLFNIALFSLRFLSLSRLKGYLNCMKEWPRMKAANLALQKKTFLHCTLHFTMPIKEKLYSSKTSQKEHLHFDDYNNSDDALHTEMADQYLPQGLVFC